MFRVFITRSIPKNGLEILRKKCEVEVFGDERLPTKAEIIQGAKDKDGLLCLLTDNIDREVISSCKKLRVITTYSAGFDHIDVETATKRGIIVTNAPTALTEATADLTFTILLAIARRVPEADRYVREKKFYGWAPLLMLGADVYGKTIGIIGAGKIGSAVARRASGFSMKILYNSLIRNEVIENELDGKRVELEELLKGSDFVTLHTSLTPETHHLLNENNIKLMKSSAFLINVSRGACIEEKALIRCLREGKIAGAAIDVYEFEPKISEELYNLPNIVLAPHIGSATVSSRVQMAITAAKDMLSALEGGTVENVVNPNVLIRDFHTEKQREKR